MHPILFEIRGFPVYTYGLLLAAGFSGPFGLVTRRADMLTHTDFGRDLPEIVGAAGFDVHTDGEGIELVVIATRPAERA